MVTYYDFAPILFGHETKQSLAKDWLGIGFAQMENVKAFLKKSSQNLVFFYEELWAGKQNKFHSVSLCRYSECKGTKKREQYKIKMLFFVLGLQICCQIVLSFTWYSPSRKGTINALKSVALRDIVRLPLDENAKERGIKLFSSLENL